ncbi:alpha-amylase [Pseudomaricurvus alkylphenolicus]|uniref:alpha-amylase family glycosyl hydrolase n=1 Tax=Pseudomaricurvus alkylphenolicus TaxID=1306991 RepID=UPI001422896F|nr:alpha-amylase family glycosyl hydrolase [Pseudomaricurvus alkylphenolicus]NIB38115.1 alpha-amylase [Pseudomaricurvus alkylphenolicus]
MITRNTHTNPRRLLCSASVFAVLTLAGCKDEVEQPLLHVPSPDWRDQVIYFLMIDRFNDGDPSNNDQGYGEYNPALESHYSGGDLKGIVDQLDYVQELGATAIWLTPPVANQWWSKDSSYSGYHGYWARDFKEVDEHYGTLDDYRALSDALHRRDMYLIQDIVVNHTGIYFGYPQGFDPEDTARNFQLFETDSPIQQAPDMAPFDQVDRTNPQHAEAAIYNWTPPINDYHDIDQQYTYQLGNLSDLNTRNPLVVDAFKESYRYWMEEVGVDAFRIDTVKYVEHEFWQQFLHDDDGIYPAAKQLGKDHFLTFGEVFESSPPYQDSGERTVASYLGSEEEPQLNSVIGFPLYFEINQVLGEGKPTSQLAYRLKKHMAVYPDPYVIPNFIDNHDTKRFLAGGSLAAFKQALAVMFTIPGVPIIYQGTEQGHRGSRQAMFAGGFQAEEDQFDQQSDLYRYIQTLSELRTGHRILTRGDLRPLASEKSGPGVLAYERRYQGEKALVLMNTANHRILVNQLDVEVEPGQTFDPLFALNSSGHVVADAQGRLNMELEANAVLVLKTAGTIADHSPATQKSDELRFSFEQNINAKNLTRDTRLSGTVSRGNTHLLAVIDGNLDNAQAIEADAEGRWQFELPIRDLGLAKRKLQLYAPEHNAVSAAMVFHSQVTDADIVRRVDDGTGDASGPEGRYIRPQHEASGAQGDIESVSVRSSGRNLELVLTMKEVSDVWVPANGFDNVSFSTFIDIPGTSGIDVLPMLDARLEPSQEWDLAHVAYGWGNYMYKSLGAEATKTGEMLGVAPKITVDKDARTIRFFYEGSKIGIDDWNDAQIYITTWDMTGEGNYRELGETPQAWSFGGGHHGEPRILDDVRVRVAKPDNLAVH